MYCLGEYYLDGTFVTQKIDKGMELLTRSAQLGMLRAQLSLAKRYRNGVAIPKNLIKAYAWYNVASKESDTAKSALAELTPLLSREQLAKAKTQADRILVSMVPEKGAVASVE